MWSIKSFQRSNSHCDLNRLWLLEPDRFSDRHNPGGSAASFTAQSAICHCGNFIIKAELFLRALLLHRMLPSVSRQIWITMYVYLTFLLYVYLNRKCACISLKLGTFSLVLWNYRIPKGLQCIISSLEIWLHLDHHIRKFYFILHLLFFIHKAFLVTWYYLFIYFIIFLYIIYWYIPHDIYHEKLYIYYIYICVPLKISDRVPHAFWQLLISWNIYVGYKMW